MSVSLFSLGLCGIKDRPHKMYLAPSPTDSEPEGWLLDTLMGTDAQVADQEFWQSDNTLDSGGPLEYRTLFDCRGFIFNIGQANDHSPSCLQAPRPTTLPLSPSPEQLATLLRPSSPGDRHLAAVLRTPLPCPSLALLRCVEVDPGTAEAELAAPRGQFLKAASNLHSRLVDLDSENSCLLHQGILLRVDFQELLATTDYLVTQARRLHQDLQDVLYLNDLLWMLRGRLERVSKRRWPFLEGHVPLGVREEANLVV
ncbi:uncharacterized protein LOC129000386 [Macrosteles quadrilineatus]|uniref:uncharacterized protein LOC129000386 n=1 Tax=Macrosteles quadrilineatus TaxID=74068 RepID=UPI0023E0B71A|nr:uncharacterized protein LOC129000386 [Macrosteles quadrilineatus]